MEPGNFKSNKQRDKNRKEINKREKALYKREKKLLKKEKKLKRKIKEYERRCNCRAKTDLRAAAKLRQARKKLLVALDSRDTLQECDPRNCNANNFKKKVKPARFIGKGKRKKENNFTDVVSDFCDKLLSGPCKQNNLLKSVLDFKRCRPYSRCLQHELRLGRNVSTRRGPREVNIWNLAAGDCYLKSLPRTPQLWIQRRWPKFYPHYMDVRKEWKNTGCLMLFIAGFLLWLPMFICLELCKCFFCACCCDFQ